VPRLPAIPATCLAVIAALACSLPAAAAERPNVVVIYADDLGYGDVQCYNPDRGKIPTPHIDQLSGEGMRFTDAHSSSGVCSPSRYTLLTSPHTPVAVNEPWRGKSGLGNACADLIMETDAVVGDVLAAIERTGVAQRTLVVFSSDNGFASYVGAADLERQGHFPSGPLRGSKGDAWEGGHRVPFIVRYPGLVRPGSVCEELVHQADLLATLADVLGAELPAAAGEDSVSLVPLLRGGEEPVRRHAVSCSMAGVPAIRDGSWKLVLGKGSGAWPSGGEDGPGPKLYDLAADLGERKNLAAVEPDRVAAMKAVYEELVAAGHSRPEAVSCAVGGVENGTAF